MDLVGSPLAELRNLDEAGFWSFAVEHDDDEVKSLVPVVYAETRTRYWGVACLDPEECGLTEPPAVVPE